MNILILIINMSLVLFLMLILIIPVLSFAQLNNTGVKPISNSSMWNSTKDNFGKAQNDSIPPKVKITYPLYPMTVTTGKIAVDANVSDSDSGVHNISARAHTFPFRGDFPIYLGTDTVLGLHNDWHFRSVPLKINQTGAYRVIIEASDNAGNRKYAETTINAVFPRGTMPNITGTSTYPKIAFVRPTFTEAAYQKHGFYDFYSGHPVPAFGMNITTDLNMLTVKTPRSVSEFLPNNPRHLSNITSLLPINGTELYDTTYRTPPSPQWFWIPFINSVEKVVPHGVITAIRDEDVDDGDIFYQNNTTNTFDVLLLFHNEYVTQAEFDNLRQFVKNGGSIVFLDSEIFRAQVSYDADNQAITFVQGHDWKFDGKAASRGLPERWYNETKKWVGSNFLEIDANQTFSNIPFSYNHTEEEFVNNPNVTILADYGIKFPTNYIAQYKIREKLPAEEKLPPEFQREDIPIQNIKVATYSLNYGKGKVIGLGLSGQLLAGDPEFMKFFETTILPNALCPKFQSCALS